MLTIKITIFFSLILIILGLVWIIQGILISLKNTEGESPFQRIFDIVFNLIVLIIPDSVNVNYIMLGICALSLGIFLLVNKM